MNLRSILILLLAAAPAARVLAYPPAPFHRVYGTVRDDLGNPLGPADGIIIMSGNAGREIVRAPSSPGMGEGANYSLTVPMDTGMMEQLYAVNAMRPALPFTIRVLRGGVSWVPIQMQGAADWKIGVPAGSTRIDLTLGVDSDNDGLPDAWEQELMRTDPDRRFQNIGQIAPGDDADGDGLSNLNEYVAGTYALDPADGLSLQVVEVKDGIARLQFLAVAKRSYRLKTSEGDAPFQAQPFSLQPSAAQAGLSYVASETRLLDIYVNSGTASRMLFKLYAD